MRIVNVFLILLLLVSGCGKDDEVVFTSLLGSWTYATPDGKIKVTFDIVGGTTDLLAIQNQKIIVDGQEGRAEIQIENVEEKTIGSLRINANDAKLVSPYNIVFTKLSASADFTTIDVEEATYTFPYPTVNPLSNIKIVRK